MDSLWLLDYQNLAQKSVAKKNIQNICPEPPNKRPPETGKTPDEWIAKRNRSLDKFKCAKTNGKERLFSRKRHQFSHESHHNLCRMKTHNRQWGSLCRFLAVSGALGWVGARRSLGPPNCVSCVPAVQGGFFGKKEASYDRFPPGRVLAGIVPYLLPT